MKRKLLYLLLSAVGAISPAMADGAARVGDVYPLDTCALSGEPLGSMGEPPVKVFEGRELRYCCAGCIKNLEKNPAGYIAKIDAKIIETQKPIYPLETCVQAGEKLGEGAVDVVIGNRLVRTCCKNCAEAAAKDPAATIEKLDKAVVEQQKAKYPLTTCAVEGGDLGDSPVDLVVAGRLVRVCCSGCAAKVEKQPAAIIAKVDAAWAAICTNTN